MPDMKQKTPVWTRDDAIAFATLLFLQRPLTMYPALTGGCLYKSGIPQGESWLRKDCDILWYSSRQHEPMDSMAVIKHLVANVEGLTFAGPAADYGWVVKVQYHGKPVDMFFPEQYPAEAEDDYAGFARMPEPPEPDEAQEWHDFDPDC